MNLLGSAFRLGLNDRREGESAAAKRYTKEGFGILYTHLMPAKVDFK